MLPNIIHSKQENFVSQFLAWFCSLPKWSWHRLARVAGVACARMYISIRIPILISFFLRPLFYCYYLFSLVCSEQRKDPRSRYLTRNPLGDTIWRRLRRRHRFSKEKTKDATISSCASERPSDVEVQRLG